MKTIEQNLTAVNDAEYKNDTADIYAENYKAQTFEIINNPNTTFKELIDELSIATDISRLGGLKQGALLQEQLSALGLYDKQKPVNDESFVGKEQKEQSSVFLAPVDNTIELGTGKRVA